MVHLRLFELQGSLSFEDSGEGSDADSDEPDAPAVEESDSSEDEVRPICCLM
jgi:hypothetical protein